MTFQLSKAEARKLLLGCTGLEQYREWKSGSAANLLRHQRTIQLDPLDPMGTNVDLVGLARLNGLKRGELLPSLYDAGGFEHYAKERCIIAGELFSTYCEYLRRSPDFRTTARMKRVPKAVLDSLCEEVQTKGPTRISKLSDHGSVPPIDWSGWKSTSKLTSMAVELLVRQCRLVVCGREGREKVVGTPKDVLGERAEQPAERPFEEAMLLERVRCAGLLSLRSSAAWSTLRKVRRSGVVEQLIESGELRRGSIEGTRGDVLVLAETLQSHFATDDHLRILGPLDAFLWQRDLVQDLFGFHYRWEVYTPPAKRKFGWYVMPLLHCGALVGRLSGRVEGETLHIDGLWQESGAALDLDALDEALGAHADACGASHFIRPDRVETNDG